MYIIHKLRRYMCVCNFCGVLFIRMVKRSMWKKYHGSYFKKHVVIDRKIKCVYIRMPIVWWILNVIPFWAYIVISTDKWMNDPFKWCGIFESFFSYFFFFFLTRLYECLYKNLLEYISSTIILYIHFFYSMININA